MKIISEIAAGIHEKIPGFILLTIQFFFAITAIFISEALNNDINNEKENISRSADYHYYCVQDRMFNEDEQDFRSKDDHIARLKILLDSIRNDDRIAFFDRHENPIELFCSDIPDIFLDGYESGYAEDNRFLADGRDISRVKCVWVGDKIWDEFGIRFARGEKWENAEEDGDVIPVVLGSAYEGLFEVGDVFNGLTPTRYEYSGVTFKVCGILEKDQTMIGSFDYINLNRYMLIPLPEKRVMPSTPEQCIEQYTTYICKLNGLVKTTLSANETQRILNDLCQKVEFYPSLYVRGASDVENNIIKLTSKKLLEIVGSLAAILGVLTVFGTLLGIITSIEEKSRYLSIMILNGFSVGECMSIVLGFFLIALILGNVIGYITGACLSSLVLGIDDRSLRWVILTDVFLSLTGMILAYVKIRKMDLLRQINMDC